MRQLHLLLDIIFVRPQGLRSFTPDLYVNLGNGQGAFTTSTVRTYGNSEYWGIAVADFNGNGNVGLIATRGNYLDFYTAAGNYEIIFSIDYEDDPLKTEHSDILTVLSPGECSQAVSSSLSAIMTPLED